MILASVLSVLIAGSVAKVPADSLDGVKLSEVVVTGSSARQRILAPRIGAERLELAKFAELPSFGGEADIIRSITLLPGVRSEGEGGGGFEVRGGNASQNLVVLDGISLYNPAHVMGIFSTFNDQAIASATIYKGPVPPGYGEASSSVLETSLAPGSMTKYHGALTVGLLAAKIKAEGPIVKNKLSFAVNARRSYVDAFLNLVPKYRSTIMHFYDVSAKLRFRPNANHLIDGSFFASRDNMSIKEVMGMKWGNIGGSINWQARASERASFVTTVALNSYSPIMTMEMMDMDQSLRTYIKTYSFNEKFRLAVNGNHTFEAGVRSELLRVKSAEWKLNERSEQEIRSLWVNSMWADYSANFADRFNLSAGFRLNLASAPAGAKFHKYESILNGPAQFAAKTYFTAEPRVSIKYNISPNHNLKAGFGMNSQNIHALRASTTSLPFDRFALTSATVKPERSMQYSAGYFGMTESGEYDWSVEGYYRRMNNVYDFLDGRGIFSDIAIESIIRGGRGQSYGAEFMVRKNSGKLTGWIAYSISQTRTRIDGINDGRWYNANNDRRHDLSVVMMYNFNRHWSLSASWIFLSGTPLTAPDVKYEISDVTCYYYSQRNAYKTPPTHRLDISAKYTHKGRRFTYEWAFGFYNLYCRYNPFIVYFKDDANSPSGTQAVLQAMYPIIPSVSYTLKF